MPSQDLQLLVNDWKHSFIIKRINEPDMAITLQERNALLKAIDTPNLRFIQIGEYTIMLNSIKSIEPRWNGNTIPPKPVVNRVITNITGNTALYEYDANDIEKLDEWEKLYKDKLV